MLSHRKNRMIDDNGCRLQVPIMVFQIQNWFTIQGSSLQSCGVLIGLSARPWGGSAPPPPVSEGLP